MSYTKGPWEHGHGLPGVYIPHQIDEDGNVDFEVIAHTVNTPDNARLIAAAPELLEALQGLLFDLHSQTWHPSIVKARQAIAKALGE